jgi:hypothetical protein
MRGQLDISVTGPTEKNFEQKTKKLDFSGRTCYIKGE